MKQIDKTTNLRGINTKLSDNFKKSLLYDIINQDKNLLACIRKNAIGIYHLADKVAMIHLDRNGELTCEINDYYIYGKHTGKEHRHKVKEICTKIDFIKTQSLKRITPEKNAQHTLIAKNNSNPDSEWFCVDMEYRQSKKVQNGVINVFDGRFDIIAVSKNSPHRVAVIELKYNSSAIPGSAGIVKHIKDFNTFSMNSICFDNLRKEITCQLKGLKQIGINVPITIGETPLVFSEKPEFYVITLWDDESDPKGTMGRYLFSDLRENWVRGKMAHVSTKNAMQELGIDVENNSSFKIKFLFKKVQSPTEFEIDDILKETLYDSVL